MYVTVWDGLNTFSSVRFIGETESCRIDLHSPFTKSVSLGKLVSKPLHWDGPIQPLTTGVLHQSSPCILLFTDLSVKSRHNLWNDYLTRTKTSIKSLVLQALLSLSSSTVLITSRLTFSFCHSCLLSSDGDGQVYSPFNSIWITPTSPLPPVLSVVSSSKLWATVGYTPPASVLSLIYSLSLLLQKLNISLSTSPPPRLDRKFYQRISGKTGVEVHSYVFSELFRKNT